jgi:hypothetical protein
MYITFFISYLVDRSSVSSPWFSQIVSLVYSLLYFALMRTKESLRWRARVANYLMSPWSALVFALFYSRSFWLPDYGHLWEDEQSVKSELLSDSANGGHGVAHVQSYPIQLIGIYLFREKSYCTWIFIVSGLYKTIYSHERGKNFGFFYEFCKQARKKFFY